MEKKINLAENWYGLGRGKEMGASQFANEGENPMFDRFAVTRSLNRPGLIFNQSITADMTRKKFFNLDL